MKLILALIGIVAFIGGVTLPELFDMQLFPEMVQVADYSIDSGILSAGVGLVALLLIAFTSLGRD
ncbi:MAG: hypothetical protein HRU11_05035 [Parvularculaceae bacterium]|nr:hypothetical protein [Parvularculaceae bacterium]